MESVRDLMRVISLCDAATPAQRARAEVLAVAFDKPAAASFWDRFESVRRRLVGE